MRIAVCDDVTNYNEQLCELLENYMRSNQITEYNIKQHISGIDLLKTFSCGTYDFIFLDVYMPEPDGFETAQRIRSLDLDVDIVFVTSATNQIQYGYRYSAKEYLCKPIVQKHIDDLMDRLLDDRRRKQSSESYKVQLKGKGGEIDLLLKDVLYFESTHHYINAVMITSEVFTFRGKLPQVEADLVGKGFVCTHRSYLVNMRHTFTVTSKQVVFNTEHSGFHVPVSKDKRKTTKEEFDRYRGWN
jgi:two-component system response regulator LytT